MLTGGPAYTRGRPDGPPIWVVMHDMEFPERPDAAEWTAAYFARGADGRSVSSHYVADVDSIIQCVRLADTAWTVGNRAGNYRGINWELAGYANQTREQWLDPFSRGMLERVAVVMRRDMARYNIPARVLTDAQVKAFTPGVTSHAQLGRAFGGTDHTDPGRSFPWDMLIGLLTDEGDDMITGPDLAAALRWTLNPTNATTNEDAKVVQALLRAIGWQYVGGGIEAGMSTLGVLNAIHQAAKHQPADLLPRLDAILAAALDDTNTTVVASPEMVAELTAIRDALAGPVADALEAMPAAVADELAARVAE